MVMAIIRPERLEQVKDALAAAGFHGMTVEHVLGRGGQRGVVHVGRGGESVTVDMLPKVKIEAVVQDEAVQRAVEAIVAAARTGHIGDGKIFVLPVEQVIRVRTGERDSAAV